VAAGWKGLSCTRRKMDEKIAYEITKTSFDKKADRSPSTGGE